MAPFSQASDFQGMQIVELLLRGECLVPDTQVSSSPQPPTNDTVWIF